MRLTEYRKFHERCLVVDSLSFPYIMEDKYFELVKKGGVDCAVITAAISEGMQTTMDILTALDRKVENNKERFCTVKSAEDIRSAKKKGQVALIYGFQDIAPIGDDIQLLKVYKKRNVHIMQLTYTGGNLAGDGCGERTDAKLKYFGLDVINEMNDRKIVIDLSHTGDASTEEALVCSKAPVMFTHANARAVWNNPRNKTDEQIRQLAKQGGYIGLTPHPALVGGENPDLNRFIDHLDHIVQLIGIDHVGLGLDYIEGLRNDREIPASVMTWRSRRPDIFGSVEDFHTATFAEDLETIDKLPHLTRALLLRGYQETQIEKILGTNFLRIFESVIG